ncbi:hypothetical protein BASA81_010728 [Batrachochytrium salamandrivorans]|nr:hypothetical protein BASA81_010728 [Batrachochytrium salamandrivorans]
MSKTRALGLSNLVVTSFDQAAAEELEANGWVVPKSLPKFSLQTADVISPSQSLIELRAQLLGDPGGDLTVSHHCPSFQQPLLLGDVGPLPVKRESKSSGLNAFNPFNNKRTTLNKRYYVLSRDSIQLGRQDEGFKPSKTLRIEYITALLPDIEGLTCVLQSSLGGGVEDDRVWKLLFTSEQELGEFTSQLALRMLIAHLLQQQPNGVDYRPLNNLSQLVSLAQPHLEVLVFPNTPLLLLSLNKIDVACELLKRRVNASALLRPWVLQRYPVQEILERANRDLNIVGDDPEFGLTLLHFYIITKRPAEIGALLLKLDLPFAHSKTRNGETPFSLAIKTCDTSNTRDLEVLGQICNTLLAFGISPDDRCASGDSAYHLALKVANLDSICIALEQYCDINLKDARGDSPLHIALRCKYIKAAKRMLTDLRLDWEQKDVQDNNALLLAMKLNEESFAIQLLTRKQPPQRKSKSLPSPLAAGVNGGSLKHLATRSSDLMVSYLLPIHLAIKLHQPSLSLLLVEMLTCEEIGLKDSTGRTCLQLAIVHSLLGVTFAIINKLAGRAPHLLQIQDECTGDDALLLAVRAGRIEVATALLINDHFKRNAFDGQTVLHAAARLVERTYHHPTQSFAAIGLFKRILAKEHAEDVNACTITGKLETVLHFAVRVESEPCGLWLLEAVLLHSRLSFEVLDGQGWTALAIAIRLCKWELAKLLIPKSRLDRELGGSGQDYLHLLVLGMGSDVAAVPVMDMLLTHGAYAGNWDREGHTPLHLACLAESSLALESMLRNDEICRRRLNDRTERTGLTPLLLLLSDVAGTNHVAGTGAMRDFDRVDLLLENGADFRLVEPQTRHGPYQKCEALDSRELFEILSRRIPQSEFLGEQEATAKAQLEISFHGFYASFQGGEDNESLLHSAEGQELLQQRALEIQRENPLCPMEAALEIAQTSHMFVVRNASSSNSGGVISQADYDKA